MSFPIPTIGAPPSPQEFPAKHAAPELSRGEVIFAFHRAVTTVSPAVLKEWTSRYPDHAEEIRAHAVEIADMELLANIREQPLSNDAAVVFESVLEFGGEDIWIPYADLGQELLDAGLVARTPHHDGRVTYRLTAAGRAWRAAC